MSDLIDRQALRKAMYHEAMEKDSDEQKWDSGCWIRYKMFERVVDSMPSAQPEPCEDAVSRSEIIRLILERGLYCDTQADREISAEIIRQLPSVQPEIIRCGECKNWETTWQNDWMPNYHYCPNVDGVRRNDFWCADGERRTE